MTLALTRLALTACALPAISGCAAIDAPAAPQATVGSCNAAPGQPFIGKTATSENGAALLAVTGAREIRWVAPRTAVTLEFKYGRLSVGYDDAMTIVSVACS